MKKVHGKNEKDGVAAPAGKPTRRVMSGRFRNRFPVNRLLGAAKKRTPHPAIPVRVCPHCGYEVRTWIEGNISCTRCENDIGAGEMSGGIPEGLRVPGISMEQ
jgi:hypothetical protein